MALSHTSVLEIAEGP